jgi:hypothetical protein
MAKMSPLLAGQGAGGVGAKTTLARSGGPALLAVSCSAALFVPWARTGAATRSGYAFVRAAQAAGLVHGPWAHVLGWSVLALPVLAAFSCASAILRAGRTSALFSGLAGLVVLSFSAWLLVEFQNDVPLGPWTGAVLGIGAVATTVRYAKQGSVLHAR